MALMGFGENILTRIFFRKNNNFFHGNNSNNLSFPMVLMGFGRKQKSQSKDLYKHATENSLLAHNNQRNSLSNNIESTVSEGTLKQCYKKPCTGYKSMPPVTMSDKCSPH